MTLPPPPPVAPAPDIGLADIVLAEWAREHVLAASLGSVRSMQPEIGPSELGNPCNRKMVYRLRTTAPVNFPDPMATTEGTGMHQYLAEYFRRQPKGRYLVEHPVTYRGIRGSVDLIDRYRRRVIDWKTTAKPDRVRRYRREGLPQGYLVQIAVYVEALREMGEEVTDSALVFLPRGGGDLSAIAAFVIPPNPDLAESAVARYQQLSETARSDVTAASVRDDTGPLCNYCAYFRPGLPTSDTGCNGTGKVPK
jgi:hypothetical protein